MVLLETKEWARVTFGECELGDQRRTKRLVKLAEQTAAWPDGSTPAQTETTRPKSILATRDARRAWGRRETGSAAGSSYIRR